MVRNDWPTSYEYDEALINRRQAFYDPDIQRGQLQEVSAGHPMRLNGGGSHHVCVYKVGNWVIRCFASDPPNNIYPPKDITERYQAITDYLRQNSNDYPFLVNHQWIKRGVRIQNVDYPILKIPYLANSRTLGDFLSDEYHDRKTVGHLAAEWFRITQQLEAGKIAHGDLDLSNVLVCGSPPAISLRLIDFDGMYIPSLANKQMSVTDNGHLNFQPAQPHLRTFGPTLDRFSTLIIYLSLIALEMNPSLWDECEANDRCLLLGSDDFYRLSQSVNFPRLRQERNNRPLQQCLDELQASIDGERMPRSLREILEPPNYIIQKPSIIPNENTPNSKTRYEGRILEIPVEEDLESIPHSQPHTFPSVSSHSQQPLQSVETDQNPFQPATSPNSCGVLVAILIIIVIAVIISFIIWSNTHSHQSSSMLTFCFSYLSLQEKNLRVDHRAPSGENTP